MSTNKYINMLTAALMALTVVFTAVCMHVSSDEEFAAVFAGSPECRYEKLFDQYQVMEIGIEIDEGDFEEMLETPLAEEYKLCDITVNGTVYANVGIRTKGNTSLSQVAASDSDRYSFKVEFDHYVSGQSLEGLDKLVLNNIFCDATYVKEYMAYDIFNYLDVACPYYAFAHITINGEEWGLYLALEAMEETFVQRVYGTREGELYKPESMDMGGLKDGGGRGEWDSVPEGMIRPDERPAADDRMPDTEEKIPKPDEKKRWTDEAMPQADETAPQTDKAMPQTDKAMPQADGAHDKGGGRFGPDGGNVKTGGGADLVYTDDAVESYREIFDHAVFSPDDADQNRVITALKQLSEGTGLETCIDVDACLRYFAAQTFIVNMDSYYSSLKHNYYLYEEGGQLTILPWDLNLAFGGFQASDAGTAVNGAIDTPMGGELEGSRPLFSKLLEVEEYRQLYHAYLRRIVDGYIGNGQFADTFEAVTALIDTYVKKDATAFYSYEEYLEGIGNLKEFILLRAESIEAQLDGRIPSTTSEQKESSMLIDASHIDLEAMGVQGGGGKGMEGGPEKFFP